MRDDKRFKYTLSAWAEAFAIFAKYDDSHAVGAEHHVIYVWISPDKVSDEDKKRLVELNWDYVGAVDEYGQLTEETEVDDGFERRV